MKWDVTVHGDNDGYNDVFLLMMTMMMVTMLMTTLVLMI